MLGEPVVVIGFGPLGYKLVSYLIKNPIIGFIPRLVIDRRKSERQDTRPIPGNVIVKKISEIEAEGQKSLGDIRTAILVTSETPGDFYGLITEISHLTFSRLIVVSAMEQQSNLWLQPYDLGGIIGLEIGQNLIDTYQQAIKRIIDVFLILAFLPVTLPLTAVVALLVALDSTGSGFLQPDAHREKGRSFPKWKFRSMVPNAGEVLGEYLEKNPQVMEEWKTSQKLKNDPRFTRLGHFIRKFSLDELPQLWNVFIGEMSLVGPRPIVSAEQYGRCYNLYVHVRPGLTGLWQVSGRSDVYYEERVRMDEYYIRNWSVWLDVIILARTPLTVLEGKGAS